MSQSKEKIILHNNPEQSYSESINSDSEYNEKRFKPLGMFLDLIKKARDSVINRPNSNEANLTDQDIVQEVDKILVYNAENSSDINNVNSAIVEGVIEDINGTYKEIENPILTIENDGYEHLLTTGIMDLDSEGLQLDSGEQIALRAAKILEKAEQEKAIAKKIDNFELNHFCSETANFSEQINEDGRDNLVTYIANQKNLYSRTSDAEHNNYRETVTEKQCLVELHDFLSLTSKSEFTEKYQKLTAQNILENLTWIGEKEYKEATKFIAEYWKFDLKSNPNLHIFPITGQIAKEQIYIDNNNPNGRQVKSDAWLLDNILSNFTNEEMEEFSDRLIMFEHQVPEGIDKQDLKLILLDDWTISGTQLSMAYKSVSEKLPNYRDCFEAQLVVGDSNRIYNNMKIFDDSGRHTEVPLRAYYKAHNKESSKPLISGYHSSVDFDFEQEISDMLKTLIQSDPQNADLKMPAGTNIVRPYRNNKRLNEVERLSNIRRSKLLRY